MRIQVVALLASLLLLLPVVGAKAGDDPSLADVRSALREFLSDENGERGRPRLEAWGDLAMPQNLNSQAWVPGAGPENTLISPASHPTTGYVTNPSGMPVRR